MASLHRVSALAGHIKPGLYGAVSNQQADVTLAELRPSALAQINGAREDTLSGVFRQFGLSPAPRANHASSNQTISLIGNGPAKWLAVSGEMQPLEFVDALTHAIDGEDATVTDLSHARTVVRVSGDRALDVLVKGCTADLDSMKPGAAMATMMVTLSAVVHRLDQSTFDVYVFRSFGLSFWEWLTDAALEYGYCIEA